MPFIFASTITLAGVDTMLVVLALIVLMGYLSNVLFRFTKIPEILLLILIGILLVPVGHLIPEAYVSVFTSLTPLVGTIALAIIMFDGGQSLDFKSPELFGWKGPLLGIMDTVLPIAVITPIMFYIFHWPIIYGALLGAVLGETTTVVVIGLIGRLKLPTDIYNTLFLETTVNSIAAILAFSLLLSVLSSNPLSASAYTNFIVDYISVGAFLGAVAGFLWIIVSSTIRGAKNYLVTLAVAFLLYAAVDLLNATPLVAVLVFAIMLANSGPICNFLKLKPQSESVGDQEVRKELRFLVTTFFFVLIGMIAFLDYVILVPAAVILVAILAIRLPEVKAMRWPDKKYAKLAYAMMPRGLTAILLASTLYIGFQSAQNPYPGMIFDITLIITILTNIISSALVGITTKGIETKEGKPKIMIDASQARLEDEKSPKDKAAVQEQKEQKEQQKQRPSPKK